MTQYSTAQTDLTLPIYPLKRRFRRRLLGWYDRNGRDLPWRKTRDPYRILVSEIMLQQTQVDRVMPKYEEWLERFPTFEVLAKAPLRRAVQAWRPLGYNIRPRRLHAIAKHVVKYFDGRLPSDVETLKNFNGLGDYTVGAVQCFAFGKRAPIVDTNISRVLFRVFVGNGDRDKHAVKQHIWILSASLLPRKRFFDFNQALMDLGAMVCLARKPLCTKCPMRTICATYATNTKTLS